MENTTLVSLVNATHVEYKDYDNKSNSVYENNVQDRNNTSNIYEGVFIMMVYSVFCLLGIIGNGLVIWFGIFRMKRTVNVVWFLNLAVADYSFAFFFLLGSTYILLTNVFVKTRMCKLTNFFVYNNVVISVLQITVISIDRCFCVLLPVWCHNHRRPRLAFIMVLIIWILSFAVAVPVMIYTETIDNNNKIICDLEIDHSTFMKTTTLEFIFLFLLPFIIIVFCYIVIVLHVRRKRIITSSRHLKTSVAVIIAFFISWFPSNLFFLLSEFEMSKFDFNVLYYGYITANLMMVINTCINPIIYVFIGRDFKEKICSSLQAMFEKAFMEEDKSEGSTALQRSRRDYKKEVI